MKEKKEKSVQTDTEISGVQQHEDAVLKTSMQFFADELLPYFGIEGKVISFAPTELVSIEIKKFFQDFNFVMEDGTWKHFEFQSTNEGTEGLRRFRAYEMLASYQHKVEITTYVLFSGNIGKPMTELTEGINTYRVVPIIMKERNADELIAELQRKVNAGETITKDNLVPLILCPLMSGKMTQKDRISAAYRITRNAATVPIDEVRKIEAMIYAMADKFLEEKELEELLEEISMTKLGQMLVEKGIEKGMERGMERGIECGAENNKIENARNLLDLLDEEVIAERIGLPLETVRELKNSKDTR
jgi:hypothetical protein